MITLAKGKEFTETMSIFIAGLLLLLASLDPLGSWLVKQYAVEERAPLTTGAVADFQRQTIVVDPEFLEQAYRDPKYAKVWASCILVHEAIHLRENTTREEIPNAFTYVCLDRLGAPAWMKDYVYQKIQATIVTPPSSQ